MVCDSNLMDCNRVLRVCFERHAALVAAALCSALTYEVRHYLAGAKPRVKI